MAQFKPIEQGIEVNGNTVYAIVDGFGTYKSMAEKILLAENIGEMKNDKYHIEMDKWYSQAAWLSAFEKISHKLGANVLFTIGQKIPQNATFPDWVKDIHSAVKSIDIAYHMNHRKNGKVMFDPATGIMLEGIGHYGYEAIQGKNMIISVCDNPYPCDFDRGIISAMATKFEFTSSVKLDSSKASRKDGSDISTYIITW